MAAGTGDAALSVAADLCPQMLLRILGVVARLGAIPQSVTATHDAGELSVEMAFDGVADDRLERLHAQLAAVVGVRAVSARRAS